MRRRKTIITLAEQIEQDNKMFAKLSKEEKKVVVAQDCIIRINSKQLKPTCGTFVDEEKLIEIFDKKDSLKAIMNNASSKVQCDVCAKGGLFMSYVGRVNKATLKDLSLDSSNDMLGSSHKKLAEIFTSRELSYIELAFEGCQIMDMDENAEFIKFTDEEIIKARKFYAKYGGAYYGKIEVNNMFDDNNYGVDEDWYDEEEGAKVATNRLKAICRNIIKHKGHFKP